MALRSAKVPRGAFASEVVVRTAEDGLETSKPVTPYIEELRSRKPAHTTLPTFASFWNS
jgi:hypothetical protein